MGAMLFASSQCGKASRPWGAPTVKSVSSKREGGSSLTWARPSPPFSGCRRGAGYNWYFPDRP
ncbi:hypothetical protein [Pseudoxanthomonas putridarboris]|uniref:hypothetical protein n=1 Tax=Pseudoxanthomonas putridarboris TaxID=752605 RepID=UPI00311F34DA